jgi:hypothetical protein
MGQKCACTKKHKPEKSSPQCFGSGRDPQIDYLAFHWYDYGLSNQLDRLGVLTGVGQTPICICASQRRVGIRAPVVPPAHTWREHRHAMPSAEITSYMPTYRCRRETRDEMFNALNHPNFSGYINSFASANFNTYTTTATNMRQMPVSAKFTF